VQGPFGNLNKLYTLYLVVFDCLAMTVWVLEEFWW